MELYTPENTKMIFWFLERCKGVEQSPTWHPEGDVFKHSLQVGALACRESNDVDLILAAYLHDVGKIILSREHPRIGCVLLYQYVSPKTLFLIKHHMRIWAYLNGEMKKRSKCQYLVTHPYLSQLIQLGRWDHMGRNPGRVIKYDKEMIIERLNKCIDKHFSIPDYLKDHDDEDNIYGLNGDEIEVQERIS